jgi:hypothetical protein
VQTFLPYQNFRDSAKVLDMRRLGKQRVETKQILLALTTSNSGWKNHPAVRMWDGHIPALAQYGHEICLEWRNRGYKDSLLPYFEAFMPGEIVKFPFWLGNLDFHAAHRSNLLRKNTSWYAQFGWSESTDLPYIWPIRSISSIISHGYISV